jgi:hypothetical protein
MAKIEVFIAGCPLCDDAVKTVRETACPKCEVTIYNLNEGEGKAEAERYGVTRVPSVVVNGRLAECCTSSCKVDGAVLRAMGVG